MPKFLGVDAPEEAVKIAHWASREYIAATRAIYGRMNAFLDGKMPGTTVVAAADISEAGWVAFLVQLGKITGQLVPHRELFQQRMTEAGWVNAFLPDLSPNLRYGRPF